jgi:hypothetical protein
MNINTYEQMVCVSAVFSLTAGIRGPEHHLAPAVIGSKLVLLHHTKQHGPQYIVLCGVVLPPLVRNQLLYLQYQNGLRSGFFKQSLPCRGTKPKRFFLLQVI